MTIDKQQLQKLLWAEAASYRADCADWKRNTEALDEFLGEKTVGEVALELLAENERLTGCIVQRRAQAEQYDQALIKMAADCAHLKAENEALSKELAAVYPFKPSGKGEQSEGGNQAGHKSSESIDPEGLEGGLQ